MCGSGGGRKNPLIFFLKALKGSVVLLLTSVNTCALVSLIGPQVVLMMCGESRSTEILTLCVIGVFLHAVVKHRHFKVDRIFISKKILLCTASLERTELEIWSSYCEMK